ncbi:MAG: hypothetical protein AAFS13_04080 [Pseudomonadota bacterium]
MEAATNSGGALIVLGVIGLVLIAALIGVLIWRQRPQPVLLMADDNQTYLVRDLEGGSPRALERPEKILDPESFVVKPVAEQRQLAFCNYDETTGQARLCRLMSEDGAVSLRLQTGAPRPFMAYTKDRHPVQVFAKLRFRLDRGRLIDAASFDDFAAVLEDRIQSALRAEIGARKDEELREDQAVITQAVAAQLQAFEAGDSQLTGAPLGITVFDMSFHYEEVSGTSAHRLQPVQIADALATDTDGETADILPLNLPGPVHAVSGLGDGNALPGAMQFSELQLDKIGDVFNDRPPEATAALLRLIELQTQQNIVEILSQSGGLVVMTAKELGLDADILKRSQSAEREGKGVTANGNLAG